MPRHVMLKAGGVTLMALGVVSFGVLVTSKVVSGLVASSISVRDLPWKFWGTFVVFVGMVVVALIGSVRYVLRALSGRDSSSNVPPQ
jgi:hypothetical protein